MRFLHSVVAAFMAAGMLTSTCAFASSHREAPITSYDHKADITDLYAFVSYGPNQAPNTPPTKVTIILCVDPFLEPANGPTWFPFDPNVLYQIHVDNNHDALEDVVFQIRYQTRGFKLPGVPVAMAGIGNNGANAPGTSTLVVPPQITDFSSLGLNLRQNYTVEMIKYKYGNGTRQIVSAVQLKNDDGSPFFAVPANVGPRTIDYDAVFKAGTYHLNNGISLMAGTTDDPFFIDLGAAFDTVNFRTLGSGVPGVQTASENSANENFASDTVSGYAVNSIALEVPISMLTSTGKVEPATSPAATIGIWGTTSRQEIRVINSPSPQQNFGGFNQIQRFGNPLINELVIGIGSKDYWSMSPPDKDVQFAHFDLDPAIVHVVDALYGGALKSPPAPRTDLLPLVTYAAPIAAKGTPAGPIADMMRLNTGVPATPPASASRLGLIGGDGAGYPNGRRLFDDAVDITLRVAVGGILVPKYNVFPNNMLGDGVNVNDASFRDQFPYLADCPSGRNRRHIDPGETGGGPVD